jgi:hypothetical protein
MSSNVIVTIHHDALYVNPFGHSAIIVNGTAYNQSGALDGNNFGGLGYFHRVPEADYYKYLGSASGYIARFELTRLTPDQVYGIQSYLDHRFYTGLRVEDRRVNPDSRHPRVVLHRFYLWGESCVIVTSTALVHGGVLTEKVYMPYDLENRLFALADEARAFPLPAVSPTKR